MPPHTNPPVRTLRPQELRPMTGPVNIPIGARPPPQRSPLMELADAFATWQPELRASLRDAAARDEKDAWALGEIQAEKTKSAEKMEDINAIAKRLVDSGELSKARLPAFREGYSRRIGSDIAMSGMQTELLSTLPGILASSGTPEAMQKATEEAITAARQKHESLLPGGDFYARVAFDERATALSNQFRSNSSAQWAEKVKSEGEAYQAYEAIDTLHNLASAPADQLEALGAGFLNTYARIRSEMPVNETNQFYASKVITPAINALVEEERYDEAEQMINRLRSITLPHGAHLADVTPIRLALNHQEAIIALKSRGKAADDLRELRAKGDIAHERASQAAHEISQKLAKSGEWPPSATKLNEALSDAGIPGDSLFNSNLDTQLRTLAKNARELRYDRAAGEALISRSNTYDATELDRIDTLLTVAKSDGSIDPSIIRTVEGRVQANRAVVDLVVPETDAFSRSVVTDNPDTMPGLPKTRMLNIGAVPKELEDYKTAVAGDTILTGIFRERMAARFRNAFIEEMRLFKNADEARSNLTSVKNKVAVKVQEAGADVLQQLFSEKTSENKRAAATQLKQEDSRWGFIQKFAEKNAKFGGLFTSAKVWDRHTYPASVEYVVLASELDASDAPKASRLKLSTKPPEGWEKRYHDEQNLPMPERTLIAIPYYWTQGFWGQKHVKNTPSVVDLDMLATEILAPGNASDAGAGNPERAAIAYGFYASAKALAGFTPEEILAGATAQKIPFNPTQINPRATSVFRDVNELEAAWEGGLPPLKGAFRNVHEKIGGLSLEAFYRAQRRLLESRK